MTGEQMALVEHLQKQAREYSGEITMADTGANTPSAFTIGSPVRPLLKIHNDGTVEADIADMPEAAKVLAEHVQFYMQQWAENIRTTERATLQATVERQAAEIARLRGSVTPTKATHHCKHLKPGEPCQEHNVHCQWPACAILTEDHNG